MSRFRSAIGAGVLVVSMSAAPEGLEPGKSRPERSKSNADFSSFGGSAAGAGAVMDGEWMSKSIPPDDAAGSEPVDSGERDLVGSTSRSKSVPCGDCEEVSSMPKSTSGLAAEAELGSYEAPAPAAY